MILLWWTTVLKSHHGVVANALDCDIEVSQFELLLRYNFDFQTNALRKDFIPFTARQLYVK